MFYMTFVGLLGFVFGLCYLRPAFDLLLLPIFIIYNAYSVTQTVAVFSFGINIYCV